MKAIILVTTIFTLLLVNMAMSESYIRIKVHFNPHTNTHNYYPDHYDSNGYYYYDDDYYYDSNYYYDDYYYDDHYYDDYNYSHYNDYYQYPRYSYEPMKRHYSNDHHYRRNNSNYIHVYPNGSR